MLRLIIGTCLPAFLALSCGKKGGQATVTPPPTVTDTLKGLIIATNGASKSIEIYDAAIKDWNASNAKKWSWRPTATAGFSTAEVNGFAGGADARLRQVSVWNNGDFIAMADAKGAAIISYPGEVRKWSLAISGNLHAAEILPNGNVAIAASDGNWIRVYCSSQGPDNNSFVQFDLKAAHAVLWDPTYQLLWVTGQQPVTGEHILTALEVTGTPAAPILTEAVAYRIVLPTAWGHDVAPYFGDVNRLWVSTNGGVYVYDKKNKSIVVAPGNANRSFVKAAGNMGPAMPLVQTRADANKSPTPTVSCTLNGWSTSTVEFYSTSGSFYTTRVAAGACFYKARPLNNQYQ